MPDITEKDLAREVKEGRLASVYLLYGEEPYLKHTYSIRIMNTAVTDFADFNLHKFESGARVEDIVSAVDAMPMMSERSCVIVRDFNFSSLADKDAEALCSIIKEPNDSCVLVFLYENIDLPKAGKSSRIMSALKENAHCVNFAKRTERELIETACRRASRYSVNMQPSSARYLISRCGEDLENLLSEVDKLCDYVGNGSIVTQKDIDEISVRTVEASAFRLGDAICAGNRDEAMSICADLFDMRTEPVIIVGSLSRAFVDLYRVKLAESEGVRPESIAGDFGYSKTAFRLTKAAKIGRRMSQSSVKKALEILRETDLALKTSRADPRIIIERAMIKLMRTVAEASL